VLILIHPRLIFISRAAWGNASHRNKYGEYLFRILNFINKEDTCKIVVNDDIMRLYLTSDYYPWASRKESGMNWYILWKSIINRSDKVEELRRVSCNHDYEMHSYGTKEVRDAYSTLLSSIVHEGEGDVCITHYRHSSELGRRTLHDISCGRQHEIICCKNVQDMYQSECYISCVIEAIDKKWNYSIDKFPSKAIVKQYLKSLPNSIRNYVNKNEEERRKLILELGDIIARMHGYEYNAKVSKENKHKIYSAGIRNKKAFLSIDELHGAYEVFSAKGKHEGQYSYSGENQKKRNGDYDIEL